MTEIGQLPFIDEHTTLVAADADDVWLSLAEALDDSFSRSTSARYARVVGCADRTASGARPFVEGSTIPGFRVVGVDPGRELVLDGRHHFSIYTLRFRLEQLASGSTLLSAVTTAAFPGLPGAAYRLLVITSRAHVVGMRRLLAGVGRRAEERSHPRT